MSFLGGLVYRAPIDGQTHLMSYITAEAQILDTNILDVIEGMFGAVPGLLEGIGDILTDALNGLVDGAMSSPALADIVSVMPKVLEQGVTLTTLSYLQGGSPQYWQCPDRLHLKTAMGEPQSYVLITSSLTELEVYACEGLSCTYGVTLDNNDVVNPPLWGVNIPVGDYVLTCPSIGFWGQVAQPLQVPHVAEITQVTEMSSYCKLSGLAIVGQSPPYLGSYLNPHHMLTLSMGLPISGYGAMRPAITDVDDPVYYQCSVPYSADYPADSWLASSGYQRIWDTYQSYIIDVVSGTNARSYPGLYVLVSPSQSHVNEVNGWQPYVLSGGLTTATLVGGLLAQWIKTRRR